MSVRTTPKNQPADLSEAEALDILGNGDVARLQRVPWSSNGTFLAHLDAGNDRYICGIYKPGEGERPLNDFPPGTLYKREYAAYLLSRDLGWPSVPTTVVRSGPYGVGSMQRYIESDPNVTYFDVVEGCRDEMLLFATFDLLINNADRKGGHCILGSDGIVWSIDHGLTFHHEFKLRTVMLEFWGSPIPRSLVYDLTVLRSHLDSSGELTGSLQELLVDREFYALVERLDSILESPEIPELHVGTNVPWPLV